ncbi:MAG: hypothetical protein V4670_07320 [Bacteroidota bacterium]
MEEKEKKSRIVGLTIIIILLLILFFAITISDKNYTIKLKNCNATTIGFTNRLIRAGKHSNVRYYFYVDSIKYFDEIQASWEYENLHKFYKVKYNVSKPDENIIFCDEELIPDSLSLVKAGFQKKKIHYYDNITATYKEKSEWK